MAESTLSLTRGDLRADIAGYLGFDRTVGNLSSAQAELVLKYFKDGLRQAYYPPPLPGKEQPYAFNFIRPIVSITTTADDGEQDLADDVHRIEGDLHIIDSTASYPPIRMVGWGLVTHYRQGGTTTGTPRIASVRPTAPSTTTGTRWEIAWYPIPDAVYTIKGRYLALPGFPTDDTHQVFGGMLHGDMIKASCLACVEREAYDIDNGPQQQNFWRLLARSIAEDSKTQEQFLGTMMGPRGRYSDGRCIGGYGDDHIVTLNGVSYP